MTKQLIALGWRWWVAIAAAVIVTAVMTPWWFSGFAGRTAPEDFTLDDAEKMCVTVTQAALDVTDSDIDSPSVEDSNSSPPGVECVVDVNVGDWYLDSGKKISLSSIVRAQVFPDASKSPYSPEHIDRNCEGSDKDLTELQGLTTCFSRHTGGSHDEATTPRRVIESATQIRNIDLHLKLTAMSSVQEGGLAEFEPSFDELLDETHAEMLAASL